jgi:toxin ParE1/3/4
MPPPMLAQTLYDGCDGLRKFPFLGRKGRVDGQRELVFSGLPYIVVYRIKDQVVELLRIYHGAQDRP